jgi:hypothetical protein
MDGLIEELLSVSNEADALYNRLKAVTKVATAKGADTFRLGIANRNIAIAATSLAEVAHWCHREALALEQESQGNDDAQEQVSP